MKKKIIALLVIFIILLNYTNCVFAEMVYSRDGGTKLNNISTIPTGDIYIDADATAKTNPVPYKDIKIYDYETENEKTINNADLNTRTSWGSLFGEGNTKIMYLMTIPQATDSLTNVATIIYKGGMKYDGEDYDVKVNLKNIRKTTDAEAVVGILIGAADVTDTSNNEELSALISIDPSARATTWDKAVEPALYCSETCKVEIDAEYYILDSTGNEVPVSGLFGLTDIDNSQGFYINGFKEAINETTNKAENIFMVGTEDGSTERTKQDTIHYKAVGDDGIYIFSSTDDEDINNSVNYGDAYLLMQNKGKINLTLTFDTCRAASSLVFDSYGVKTYHKIKTKVTGGTITPTITGIRDGENKTISFAPENEHKYLKSIKIDGVDVTSTISGNETEYPFTNILRNHAVEIVYADKLAVTHDPKGGSPTPDVQYVKPNEVATQVTEPTKNGYTFTRWQKVGEAEAYDYTTPVTENITLEAVWTPISYNITYVLNDEENSRATNDPQNPSTYTIEDTIDFKNPTREGYNFIGWFEDEELTTPKAGISNETGDKTVYAKWEKRTGVQYKVEHYKETTKGVYELVVTDELSGNVGETATATPKQYTGFKENTTHTSRIPSGTILEDGSLVLKLYYDKEEYTVTFDTDGGSKNPDNQTVKYQDKATKPTNPTKTGYEFQYWYYKEDGNEIQYDFNDPVTRNIDLIAEWEKVESAKPSSVQEDDDKPSKLPKTGENVLYIGMFSIIAVAGTIFGIKYRKLKDIK